MILRKFYLKCLAHGSYLLADEESKEAALIDPQRDVEEYLGLLREGGYRLKYVLETHVHADFVSGHWELAERTGAQVVFGAAARTSLPHLAARDGEELMLGRNISIRVLETPGHTPESVCYLARDLRNPEDPGTLFSGDTLFVGDVGRPDLLGARMPADHLASMLHDSLERKIKTLPDATRVYPAHGAGSACGKHIGDAEFTTIGDEKRTNAALRTGSREEFISLVTSDLPDAPAYFSDDARINLEGSRPLAQVVDAVPRLTPRQVREEVAKGALILDVRPPDEHAAGAPQGSLNISLDGSFAPWLGALVPLDAPLVLLTGRSRETEAITRCARIGFENIRGTFADGLLGWTSEGLPLDSYARLSPEDFIAPDGPSEPMILDVRTPTERKEGFVPGSRHIPLNRLSMEAAGLPKDRPLRIYCGGGYRSPMAVGLLRKLGHAGISDMAGGWSAYLASNLPVEGLAHV